MSKVFIAWSGNFDLALKLRNLIDERPGYEAVVGGNTGGTNNIYVGGTIIEQMKGCDQAVLLIQENAKHAGLSRNIMFEWGYLLAKLNPNKTHHYLIDNPDIPTDLIGVWAHNISSDGRTADEIAQELCDIFFSSQHNLITKNKMRVIIDRDETRNIINKHSENPVYSNYEMAQFVLCYMFCAIIYPDTREEARKDINKFYENLNEHALQSPELSLAVKCAKVSLAFLLKVRYEGDEQSISHEDFFDLRESYEELAEEIKELSDSEVKQLLGVVIGDLLTYLYLLIINGDELPADTRHYYSGILYEYSEKVVEECDKLERMSPKMNAQLMRLVRAYMYRDMYCALDCMEKLESEGEIERVSEKEERLEMIKRNLYLSLEERKKLYNEYSVANVNMLFMSNIEMEYFLALAEYSLYETDVRQKERMKEKLLRYVRNADKVAEQKRVFTEKIRGYIKK